MGGAHCRGCPTLAESVIITGVVERVNGTSPGPSSGITYDITANLPSGPVRLTNQRPSVWRYGDAVDIDAGLLVGRLVIGAMIGQYLWWEFYEPQAFALCPGVTPPPNPLTIQLDPRTGIPPPPPPPGSGGTLSTIGGPAASVSQGGGGGIS